MATERNKEWQCCFCLHVRTGTIMLGTWHIALHLIALTFLAAIVRDPRLANSLDHDDLGSPMPTPLSKIQVMPTAYPQKVPMESNQTLVYFCTLAITFLLLYGATSRRAAYLLPFFCLQIFDFAITVLTATGYLCYLRSVQHVVAHGVPWREQLIKLSPAALAFFVFLTFLVAILFKGYFISVVWRCYKYLSMRDHTLQIPRPTTLGSFVTDLPTGGRRCNMAGISNAVLPDYNNLLPKYEDIMKQSPPPSYSTAICVNNVNEMDPIAAQGSTFVNNTAVVVVPQQQQSQV